MTCGRNSNGTGHLPSRSVPGGGGAESVPPAAPAPGSRNGGVRRLLAAERERTGPDQVRCLCGSLTTTPEIAQGLTCGRCGSNAVHDAAKGDPRQTPAQGSLLDPEGVLEQAGKRPPADARAVLRPALVALVAVAVAERLRAPGSAAHAAAYRRARARRVLAASAACAVVLASMLGVGVAVGRPAPLAALGGFLALVLAVAAWHDWRTVERGRWL